MFNPWILLGLVVAWGFSLVAVGAWQNDDGATKEKAKWQGKENAELAAANKKIESLNVAARKREADTEENISGIAQLFEREKENAEATRRRDVDAARSGAIRLSVPGGCRVAGSGAASTTPAATPRSDDAAAGELSREVTASLLALADDADANTRQLTACQAVITGYFNASKGAP
jgi:hypothetical protein